ncbi:hypothetical protein KMY75_29575, partial [Klebsiella quasipneumoniae]|nr:hypothetical protein [Klebsiella quasipneumoniae]
MSFNDSRARSPRIHRKEERTRTEGGADAIPTGDALTACAAEHEEVTTVRRCAAADHEDRRLRRDRKDLSMFVALRDLRRARGRFAL